MQLSIDLLENKQKKKKKKAKKGICPNSLSWFDSAFMPTCFFYKTRENPVPSVMVLSSHCPEEKEVSNRPVGAGKAQEPEDFVLFHWLVCKGTEGCPRSAE